MQLDILDQNVSVTMNVFLIIANILNLVYNIPQMVQTYRTKTTRDFSTTFLLMRVVGNIIWVVYSVEIGSVLFLINNVVTVVASLFIGYYKVCEIIQLRNTDTAPVVVNSASSSSSSTLKKNEVGTGVVSSKVLTTEV
jgi:MtN3 and saliva related transmembrane protein